MFRASLLAGAAIALALGLFASTASAQGAQIVLQNFDGSTPPKNKEGVGYPTFYQGTYGGGVDGGTFSTAIDTSKKIAGSGSLKMTFTSGAYFYAQFNPYNGTTREFTRNYALNPSSWKFNTYNRMRFWFWAPSGGEPENSEGQHNFYMGTYVKRVTNADAYSDEAGGAHFYHPFNVMRNTWSLCTLNMHPGHGRGEPGGVDSGNVPYPTSGDPSNTYNYFDALTRWYISGNGGGTVTPRTYWLDDISFIQQTAPENDKQVYGVCASYTQSGNRLFLTWNRHKDENSTKHEVRYSFSDIHTSGWNSATTAPSGTISPPGYQGYNGMVYNTTGINVSGKSTIYFAIKPQDSSVFSQIALPLNGSETVAPSAPTSLSVQ
jgi:hypothetical protein